MATGRRKIGAATRAVVAELKAERVRQNATRGTKWTQVTLAEASGVPKDTIKGIDAGRSPLDVEQLFALSEALGVAPSEIVARAEQSEPLGAEEGKQSDARK